MCSITERKKDNLRIDGAGPWGANKTIGDYFIKIISWKGKPNEDFLGSGYYYCSPEVSRNIAKDGKPADKGDVTQTKQ